MTQKVVFSAQDVISKMGEVKGKIEEFATTVREINDLVDDLVQKSENSAVYGDFGARLKEVWNCNKSEVDEFVDNFELWSEVVTVITATNENFVAEATNTYKGERVTKNGAALANGEMSSADRLANTSFKSWHSFEEAAAAGHSEIRTRNEFYRGGDDLNKYGSYDIYLKAMYDKNN